jgi:hypothetical protein
VASLQLPQGPSTDSYNIYLSVNIVDDTNGVTTYSISNPVQVLPNQNLASTLTNSSGNTLLIAQINSGNINAVASNSLAISTSLNMQFNESQSLTQTSQISELKEYLVEKVGQLSVADSNSILTITSALSSLTQLPNHVSSNMAVRFFLVKILHTH